MGLLVWYIGIRYHVSAENPCSEEDDYRQEVLIALRRLERLDKDEFNEEERAESEEIAEQRREAEAKQQVSVFSALDILAPTDPDINGCSSQGICLVFMQL